MFCFEVQFLSNLQYNLRGMKQLILIAILFGTLACGKEAETTRPVKQSITSSVYASGVIKSDDQYQVFPTVSGTLLEQLVDDGQTVHKGQALFKIDNSIAALNAQNAALMANFNAENNNQSKLEDAADAVRVNREKVRNDSLLFTRFSILYQQGTVSKVDLEQRELAFLASKNNYSAAVNRYKDLKRQLKFSAQQSETALAISSKTSGDFTIKSEVDGVVYSVLKEKGELVSPQTPLAIIGSANSFQLIMQIDEYDIAKIAIGQTAIISTDSYKGQSFEAVITKIIPIMNERSKTFTVEARFTKAPPKIFPNTSFEASIVLAKKANALLIPKRFLLPNDMVLLKSGEKRKVTIGLRDFEWIEIIQGLSTTDEIQLPE